MERKKHCIKTTTFTCMRAKCFHQHPHVCTVLCMYVCVYVCMCMAVVFPSSFFLVVYCTMWLFIYMCKSVDHWDKARKSNYVYAWRQLLFFEEKRKSCLRQDLNPSMFCVLGRRSTLPTLLALLTYPCMWSLALMYMYLLGQPLDYHYTCTYMYMLEHFM